MGLKGLGRGAGILWRFEGLGGRGEYGGGLDLQFRYSGRFECCGLLGARVR